LACASCFDTAQRLATSGVLVLSSPVYGDWKSLEEHPLALPKDYDDLPGTVVFDADQARRGYHLNMFCMSLMKPENRAAFKADERGYLDKWPMTEEQKQAVLKRDWNGMLELGGNIYFTAKIAATDGLSFQQIAAMMTGSTQEEYAKMMLNGGRSPAGNRSKSEWNTRG